MIIAANWKMNLSRQEAKHFVKNLNVNTKHDIILFPSFLLIDTVYNAIEEREIEHKVSIGGQDCHHEEKGSYTGSVSSNMLVGAGANYVLINHSERWAYYRETNALAKMKANVAMASGLKVILCVGETYDERDSKTYIHSIKARLDSILTRSMKNLIIAYEPKWAIGTNKTPNLDQITEMHDIIDSKTKEYFGEELPFLYGGSVDVDNANGIMSLDCVDGLLIGNSSLDVNKFNKILRY